MVSGLPVSQSVQAGAGLPIWGNYIMRDHQIGLDGPQGCCSEAEIARQRASLRLPIPGFATMMPWEQRLMGSETCS